MELREPVALVLTSGREVHADSSRLMRSLDRVDGQFCRVLGLREGTRELTRASVGGLNAYLGGLGMARFRRQSGAGRWATRYGWSNFKELLGLEFEGANVVLARLPAGPYFGAPAHPALLVACWDGDFSNLAPYVR
ncbi:MAG TPA: hypothetical protein VK163_01300 [Opitutaceae bacterium]|nr:hypothetical protein [Opitutaceae bacterium]